jgi:UPF0755 protein
MRTFVTALFVLILVAVAGSAFAYWTVLLKPATDVPANRSVQIEIAKGTSTARIAEDLAKAGVIRNANMFRLEVQRADAGGSLKAGVYELSTGMPYDLVIEKLAQGPPIAYVSVTIPEGFTVEQIASRLEKQADIPAPEFLELAQGGAEGFADKHPYLKGAYKASLEGFLFPKTYRLKEGTTATDAIEMMLAQFDKEIASVDLAKRAEKSGHSLQEVVIVASIIEREARLDKDRPLVSSVIYNRLKRNMRLQMCATLEYVLPGNRLRLSATDLKTKSPYNTYIHTGLTPGPISNPGLVSLEAAVSPAKTNYIYYVLTGKDGSHTFAADSEEFLKAKRKSKEVFGE